MGPHRPAHRRGAAAAERCGGGGGSQRPRIAQFRARSFRAVLTAAGLPGSMGRVASAGRQRHCRAELRPGTRPVRSSSGGVTSLGGGGPRGRRGGGAERALGPRRGWSGTADLRESADGRTSRMSCLPDLRYIAYDAAASRPVLRWRVHALCMPLVRSARSLAGEWVGRWSPEGADGWSSRRSKCPWGGDSPGADAPACGAEGRVGTGLGRELPSRRHRSRLVVPLLPTVRLLVTAAHVAASARRAVEQPVVTEPESPLDAGQHRAEAQSDGQPQRQLDGRA